MTNSFFTWSDFVDNFGAEMRIATEVYEGMVRTGLKDWDTVSLDFDFVSDRRESVDRLRDFLQNTYGYSVSGAATSEGLWEISGKTQPIPITADSLMYWALDLALRGYEFDARFDAYGGTVDPDSNAPADVNPNRAEFWFDWGLQKYEAGDRAAAQLGFSAAIACAPDDPNS